MTDPAAPTRNTGNALDPIYFKTGGRIPETLLPLDRPAETPQGRELQGEFFYPARAVPQVAICDHFPVFITIPCELAARAANIERLAPDWLTDEEWEEKNDALREE